MRTRSAGLIFAGRYASGVRAQEHTAMTRPYRPAMSLAYYSGFMCKMQAPALLLRYAHQNLQKPAAAAPQTYLRCFLCAKNISKKCKKRLAFCTVVCYNNQALKRRVHKQNMGAFPSGQWGQTVNLLLNASVVRIHPRPPNKKNPNLFPIGEGFGFFVFFGVSNQK